MSIIKNVLANNRKRKAFVEAGNSIEDYREEKVVEPLPVEKPINKGSDQHDQCFVIFPDIHSYQRDKKAFNLAMRSLPYLNKAFNVTKFIQLGDALECGEGSSHPPSSVYERVPSYVEEIDWAVNDFWIPVKEALPSANYYALMGNHEHRWDKKLARDIGKKLPQEYLIETYTGLMPYKVYEDIGIHVTPYGNTEVKDNILELIPERLFCIHGWSHAKQSASTHLRGVQGAYSVIFGHTHRSQHDSVKNPITKRSVEAWSFGSLAKVEMKWHNGAPNDHLLGFGIVHVHGDDFNIMNIPISINRKDDSRKVILPEGTVLVER